MNIIDDDKKFEIDVRTRKVRHTDEGEVRLIQGDHNSERITFTMDRYVENHDMSSCSKVEIHFINVDSSGKKESEDVYTVDDVAVDSSDDKIIFSWLVSKSATQYAGIVSFGINFTTLDESNKVIYSWRTGINKDINIGESINCKEGANEEYSDILAKWEERWEERLDDYIKSEDLIVTCNAEINAKTNTKNKTITISNASASYNDIRTAYKNGADVILKADFGDACFIYARIEEDAGGNYRWSFWLSRNIKADVWCSSDDSWMGLVFDLATEEKLNLKQNKDFIVTCTATINKDKTVTIKDASASYVEIKEAMDDGVDVILEVDFDVTTYYARLDENLTGNPTYRWSFIYKGEDDGLRERPGDFICYIGCHMTNSWDGYIVKLITKEAIENEIVVDCHAGAKGYYYSHIDLTNKKIYLSGSQVLPQLGAGEVITYFETPAYEAGNGISIVNSNKYDYLGRSTATIKSVSNNVIEYDGDIGFTKINSVSDFSIDDYTLYVPDQPDIGRVKVREGGLAIGDRTTATGSYSFATNREGGAHGNYSFTSGRGCRANYCSDAGGYKTKGNGQYTFTRGSNTEADADNSSALGKGTKATTPEQVVHGRYNIIDTLKKFAHIVGNGTSKTKLSNAYTLDWEGNGWFANDVRFGNISLKELIPPQMHARFFRGKNLGATYTAEQQAAVKNGTFDDLFVGDYWEIDDIKWRIVDMDYWYGTGHLTETPHHLVIMPDTYVSRNVMNDTYSTEGGYMGSKIYTEILPGIVTSIKAKFNDRVWGHEEYFVDMVDNGRPIERAQVVSYVDLPSEIMMYGTRIWSYGNDGKTDLITYCNTQLALFNLVPYYIQPSRNPNYNTYWLRDTASEGGWAYVDPMGRAGRASADVEEGIRPVFALY